LISPDFQSHAVRTKVFATVLSANRSLTVEPSSVVVQHRMRQSSIHPESSQPGTAPPSSRRPARADMAPATKRHGTASNHVAVEDRTARRSVSGGRKESMQRLRQQIDFADTTRRPATHKLVVRYTRRARTWSAEVQPVPPERISEWRSARKNFCRAPPLFCLYKHRVAQKVSHYRIIKKIVLNRIQACQ